MMFWNMSYCICFTNRHFATSMLLQIWTRPSVGVFCLLPYIYYVLEHEMYSLLSAFPNIGEMLIYVLCLHQDLN